MLGSYHDSVYLEGQIKVRYFLRTNDPKALYEPAAEWDEFMECNSAIVFTEEQVTTLIAKICKKPIYLLPMQEK